MQFYMKMHIYWILFSLIIDQSEISENVSKSFMFYSNASNHGILIWHFLFYSWRCEVHVMSRKVRLHNLLMSYLLLAAISLIEKYHLMLEKTPKYLVKHWNMMFKSLSSWCLVKWKIKHMLVIVSYTCAMLLLVDGNWQTILQCMWKGRWIAWVHARQNNYIMLYIFAKYFSYFQAVHTID